MRTGICKKVVFGIVLLSLLFSLSASAYSTRVWRDKELPCPDGEEAVVLFTHTVVVNGVEIVFYYGYCATSAP